MKREVEIMVVAVAGWILPFISHGSLITIDGHTNGQSATLAEHQPTTVQAAVDYVDVRRRNVIGSERNNVGVFKFSTSTIASTATNVVLSFGTYKAVAVSTEILVYGLNDDVTKGSVTEANWTQSTITYNTMPGMNDSDGNMQTSDIIAADTTYLGTISVAGGTVLGGTLSLSTAELTNFINGDSNNTVTFLLVARNVASGVDEDVQILSGQRSSSGSSSYPTLTVETIPEPATAGLTLFAAAIVLFTRRTLF